MCVCVTPPTCSDNDVTLCYEGDVQFEELSQHDLQSPHITSVIRPHNTFPRGGGGVGGGGGGGGFSQMGNDSIHCTWMMLVEIVL